MAFPVLIVGGAIVAIGGAVTAYFVKETVAEAANLKDTVKETGTTVEKTGSAIATASVALALSYAGTLIVRKKYG